MKVLQIAPTDIRLRGFVMLCRNARAALGRAWGLGARELVSRGFNQPTAMIRMLR
jgi:hypothetical protein